MVTIDYLTEKEFTELGFDEVDSFDSLSKRATIAIDLFINHFYDKTDFDSDVALRKKAIKLAMAFQITYLDSSGVMTAEDKQTLTSVSLGRTSVSYQNSSRSASLASRYNLSTDSENILRQTGFGYSGVFYDR